jgi:hypothetical protein
LRSVRPVRHDGAVSNPLLAAATLQLPVRLHGIQLGRPTDLLLDTGAWRALGFVVRCGDDSVRFLPYAACQPLEEEIAVGSALMLLEDVGFYQKRGVSYRSLLDGDVIGGGVLRDVVLGQAGKVTELVVEHDGTLARIPAGGAAVIPTRASAA